MNGFWGAFLSLVYFVLLFSAILFLAYVSTKILGVKSAGRMRGKHLIVVDSIGLGFDKRLMLVKVGDKFFLVASSNKNINSILPIEDGLINMTDDEIKEIEEGKVLKENAFKSYLDFFKNKIKNQKEITTEKQESQNSPFSQNLSRVKDIFSKINSQEDGEEKK